jgi:hypothetical protein
MYRTLKCDQVPSTTRMMGGSGGFFFNSLIMIQHFEFHMSIEKLANLVYSLVFGSLLVFCSIFNSGYGSLIFLFRSHWFWWFSYVPLRKQFLPESPFLVSVFSRTCH